MEQSNLMAMAELYREAYPNYPPLVVHGNWLYGVWELGNNYKGSGFYGSYPNGYLRRVMCMFPDVKSILHLFSGSLPPGPYTRFDCHEQPDYFNNLYHGDVIGDAHELSRCFPTLRFDLVLADPPYTKEDAKRYGTPMVNRAKVMREVAKVVYSGGWLVWLDTVKPMYRKSEWVLRGEIAVVGSTNHRVRMCFIFQRGGENNVEV